MGLSLKELIMSDDFELPDLIEENDIQDVDSEEIIQATENALVIDKFDEIEGKRIQNQFEIHNGKDENLKDSDWQDFFNLNYNYCPEVQEHCINETKSGFVDSLLKSEEFQRTKEMTAMNMLLTEIASFEMSKNYSELIKKNEKKPKNKKMNQKSAVNKTIKKIQEEVENIENTMRAIGTEDGNLNKISQEKLKETYNLVKNNKKLKSIFDLAGKYRLLAKAKQKQKVTHGYDDMIGTTQTDDVARLLPNELVGICHPKIQAVNVVRLIEKQTLGYEYLGEETAAKGPIIVCVDESGSMNGARIENAKAFCLAMGLIAKMQKRWIAFVGFSSFRQGHKVCFPPNQWNQQELLSWILHFFSGGTDQQVPLVDLPFTYWKEFESKGLQKGKTDIIYITDGEISVSDNVRDKFIEWKKLENCTVNCITIGAEPGGLQQVCDNVYLTNSLGIECEGVQQVMSI